MSVSVSSKSAWCGVTERGLGVTDRENPGRAERVTGGGKGARDGAGFKEREAGVSELAGRTGAGAGLREGVGTLEPGRVGRGASDGGRGKRRSVGSSRGANGATEMGTPIKSSTASFGSGTSVTSSIS